MEGNIEILRKIIGRIQLHERRMGVTPWLIVLLLLVSCGDMDTGVSTDPSSDGFANLQMHQGISNPLLSASVPLTNSSNLVNISTRSLVQTGNNVEIGGFIIGGTDPKTVLIRARGPSLGGAPFNIPGVLGNPTMQLYSGSTVIAQNNDWQTTDPLCGSPVVSCGGAVQIIATGLDPCLPNPGQTSAPPGCALESVILVTLPPGGYTAIVSGVGGTTGVGLVEVFEVGTSTSKLVNISTRARVETGNNVEIVGVIIGGTDPKTVLIRARGPSMSGAPFNLPGTLSNPTMQLYSGSTVIAQNNNWQTTDPLCGSPAVSCGNATQISATGLDPCQPNPGQPTAPPGCSQESAILATLPPGGYTAIVSGVGGTSGVGLVEVFETASFSLGLQTVATGLTFPLFLTTPPGDSSRLFIVEKGGTIRIIKNGTLLGTPFLNISSLVSTGGEQGLLGLAFDPNYAINGRLYVSYTDTNGNSQIVRYLVTSNPDIAQATADRVLLSINQPFSNHNGGNIVFGPDGYLYIGMGDGGSGNDPQGNGQDLTDLLGSLLRIDVSPPGNYIIPNDNPFKNQPSAREELWDYGLRNPWRFSFDRLTGDLYIADVGQSAREEINVALATSGGGKGLNYGWNIMEGTICTPGVNPNCNMAGLSLPVLDYDHSGGSCSVTGGYVYRGSTIPGLLGAYFYADYCAGWVRSFRVQNGQAIAQTQWSSLSPGGNITSFGEDTQGEIYILTSQGGVYRIVSN